MKIKFIKPEHVTNCHFCKADGNKVRAQYHLTGANKQACEGHKHKLEALRDAHERINKQEPSEADHQTWMRL